MSDEAALASVWPWYDMENFVQCWAAQLVESDLIFVVSQKNVFE